jgi:hypothetical protein
LTVVSEIKEKESIRKKDKFSLFTRFGSIGVLGKVVVFSFEDDLADLSRS